MKCHSDHFRASRSMPVRMAWRTPFEISMSEALVTYLSGHTGGAQIAVQLLEAIRDQHDDQEFRRFASYCYRRFRRMTRQSKCSSAHRCRNIMEALHPMRKWRNWQTHWT
jgi:hypothetical protein